MRRRLAAAICVLMLIPLLASFQISHAADSYLITIAEETVLEGVSDNEMATFIDGIIYAPYTVLRSMRSVYVNYNQADQLVTVWRTGATIQFELATGLTYDLQQQRAISIPAKMRGGVPYLPLSVVTAWMGMYFSVSYEVDEGINYPVIRMTSAASPRTSDSRVFSDNKEKLQEVSQARDQLSGIGTDTPSNELPPVLPALPVRYTRLLFTGLPQKEGAGEILSDILSTLERFSIPAAFFLSEEDTAEGAESLREICGRGFTPGIWITDGENPLEQAQRVAQWCVQTGHLRVRLVCCSGLTLTDQQREGLEAAGFVLWSPNLDPYSSGQRRLLTRVQQSLRNAPDQSALQLKADEATRDNLVLICSYLSGQNFVAQPVEEWTQPVG